MEEQLGAVTFIGSGEFGEAMARVYRSLVAGFKFPVNAVFVDTPAGFEVNADDISAKAVEYFRKRLGVSMSVASWRSRERAGDCETKAAVQALSSANFILAGPGSPTYAIRQWQRSPVWDAVTHRLVGGAHLLFASAAAIAAGRQALPVYEIYKAGHDMHWAEGLDLLGSFAIKLAIIPHWNNAEGGKFDTRFCFMGQARWDYLETLLPPDTAVLGIDEHTAVTLDLRSQEGSVHGVGQATIRHQRQEWVYPTGSRFPLDQLRTEDR